MTSVFPHKRHHPTAHQPMGPSAADSVVSGVGRPVRRAATVHSKKRRRLDIDQEEDEETFDQDESDQEEDDFDDEDDEESSEGGATCSRNRRASNSKKKLEKPAGMSAAEWKAEKRKAQNRRAAKGSRERKQALMHGLEAKLKLLQTENADLRLHTKSLSKEVDHLRRQLASVQGGMPALSDRSSPLTPSTEVLSSAPSSPTDFSSAASTTSLHSATRRHHVTQRANRQKVPPPPQPRVHIDIAALHPAMNDELPLSSPRFEKLPSIDHLTTILFPSDFPVDPLPACDDASMLIEHAHHMDLAESTNPYTAVFETSPPVHTLVAQQRARSETPASAPHFHTASSYHLHQRLSSAPATHYLPSASPSSPSIQVDHHVSAANEKSLQCLINLEETDDEAADQAVSSHQQQVALASDITMMLALEAMRAITEQQQQWVWRNMTAWWISTIVTSMASTTTTTQQQLRSTSTCSNEDRAAAASTTGASLQHSRIASSPAIALCT
jgi:hypothetical protein